VLVAGHSRVSQRADENGVGLVSQVLEAWIRKGLPGLEIVVGRPGQPFDLESDTNRAGRGLDGGESWRL
jgi:hypothetical protein